MDTQAAQVFFFFFVFLSFLVVFFFFFFFFFFFCFFFFLFFLFSSSCLFLPSLMCVLVREGERGQYRLCSWRIPSLTPKPSKRCVVINTHTHTHTLTKLFFILTHV